MDGEERYWLALTRLRGVKRPSVIEALKRFTPDVLFERCRSSSVAGEIPASVYKALKDFEGWDWVDRELSLVKSQGIRLITFSGPSYPALLKEIYDPPLLLYAKGGVQFNDALATVAVVGTRRPTHYGLKMSETISRDLASCGAVIVSGMARGCDAAAHRGALSAGGLTVAVLGTGVDIAYPRENKGLYEEIAEKGMLLSELPMSTPPKPFQFPLRNRVISGLSRGVLVVEAPLRSGAMTTAGLALDCNRDVFSVPGPATSYKSRGTNKLLKDGAMFVEDAGDIFDALGIVPKKQMLLREEKGPEANKEESFILRAFGSEPLYIDEIIEKTGFTPAKVSASLLEMELKGLVVQRPGKCFLKRF